VSDDRRESATAIAQQLKQLGYRVEVDSSGERLGKQIIDGNKRTDHAATETFLVLNGLEINAFVDEQERVLLAGDRIG
jgi:CheY-like chemotaxis protein